MCDSAFLPDSKLRFPPEILNKVVLGLLDLLILLAQLCFGRFLYFRSLSASLSLKLSLSKKVENRVCKTKDFGAAVSCVAVSLHNQWISAMFGNDPITTHLLSGSAVVSLPVKMENPKARLHVRSCCSSCYQCLAHQRCAHNKCSILPWGKCAAVNRQVLHTEKSVVPCTWKAWPKAACL